MHHLADMGGVTRIDTQARKMRGRRRRDDGDREKSEHGHDTVNT